ncbi:MAG: glycosyltransferase family 2 protein [Syntrophales bacterium]
MNDTLPHVSLVIPTFNDCTDLLPCLESLRRLNYPKDKAEIIIWDNASADGTVEMVRKQYSEMEKDGWAQLKLIEWNNNEGTYIPYNLAQEYLSPQSQYILGLDADVELSENVLISLINAAQEDRVAAVGARSVYYDQPSLTSHGAGFVNRWTGFYNAQDPEGRIECDYVIGCCWLLNRDVFKSLGGFDPDYYLVHWEVDYCLRAKNAGYRILYEPKAVARHKIPINSPIGSERICYIYRNKIMLIKKIFRPPKKWLALTCHLMLGVPKAIYDSFLRNKGYDHTQIKVILRAFCNGWLGRTGKSV